MTPNRPPIPSRRRTPPERRCAATPQATRRADLSPGRRAGPRRGATTVTVLAAVVFFAAPSAAGAEKRSAHDRSCASAVRGFTSGVGSPIGLEIPVPAPIGPFLRTELGDEGPTSPWATRRGGKLVGVAVARHDGTTILSACEEVPDSRHIQAAGRAIAVPRGERLIAVTVAHPWIAWATRERTGSLSRPIVRWRQVSSADGTAQTVRLRRRITALVPDVGGQVTVSTVGGGTQRIDTYDRQRRRTRIATFGGVSSDPAKALRGELRDVWLWEPRTLAIDRDIASSFSVALADFPKTAPSRIVDLPRTATPCRLRSPGDVDRLRTTLAAIDVINAEPWTNNDTTHVRICDGKGRLVARGTLDASSDGGSSSGGTSLIGNAFVVPGITIRGSSAGSESERIVRILERTPSGRLVIGRQDDTDVLVTGKTAAAWITTKTRQLWVSDGQGVRRIDVPLPGGPNPFPSQRNEARLTLTDRALEVRSPQGETTSAPITPLPASAVAVPQPSPVDQGCEENENRSDTCTVPSL